MKGRATITNVNITTSVDTRANIHNTTQHDDEVSGTDNSTFALVQGSVFTFLDNGIYRIFPVVTANNHPLLVLNASKSMYWEGTGSISASSPSSSSFSSSSWLKYHWWCEKLQVNESWNQSNVFNNNNNNDNNNNNNDSNSNDDTSCGNVIDDYLQTQQNSTALTLSLQSLDDNMLYHFSVQAFDEVSNQSSWNGILSQYVIKSDAVDLALSISYQPRIPTCHHLLTLSIELLSLFSSHATDRKWNVTYHISPPLLNGTAQATVILLDTVTYHWVITPINLVPGQTYIVQFQAVLRLTFFFFFLLMFF
ncbi:hypothetical protein RFI_30842 [Reticulomyxa filosa]|uniref:Uncharacterized protein n=1 Tax=Reticulomyxa filosa TaxID=46433 RepID=X6M0P6_RETFI|nr:hypothetical protein RFI_30842 [Reticulomyxa filosa]|eukprot:ETO06550.1 hypothetical protein RFI_30842 [Reticulomyxa filosa]